MIRVVIDRHPRGGLSPDMTHADGLKEIGWFFIVDGFDPEPDAVTRLNEDAVRTDLDVELADLSGGQRLPF